MSEELVTGRRAVVEAIRAGQVREVLVAAGAHDTQGLRAVREAARAAKVPVPARRNGGSWTGWPSIIGGVVARTTGGSRGPPTARGARPRDPPVRGRRTRGRPGRDQPNPQNLGAAARTAEAAGAAAFVTRDRRAAGVTPAAVRASAGALEHLSHAVVANIARALARLQEAGFTVVGLDDAAPRTIFEKRCPDGRVAVVIGSRERDVQARPRTVRPARGASRAGSSRLVERFGGARRRALRLRPPGPRRASPRSPGAPGSRVARLRPMSDIPTPPPPDGSFGVPTPQPTPAPAQRPGAVTGAAVILSIAGALALLFGSMGLAGDGVTIDTPFQASGSSSRIAAAVLAVQGAQPPRRLAGPCASPRGRILGIVLVVFGIVSGLAQLRNTGSSGFLTLALDAYVLYVLFAYAFVFKERPTGR